MQKRLLQFLYSVLVLPLLAIFYGIGVLINRKIRTRFNQAGASLQAIDARRITQQCIWFHCASMGECEQAKPVMEALRQQHPEWTIALSFSSPSGYITQRDYATADLIFYLPFDTRARMRSLIARLRPSVVVVSRYDLWWNMAYELKKRDVPIIILNATYPSSRWISLPPFAQFYRELLSCCHTICAVDSNHQARFSALKPNCTVLQAADTRYDRLVERVDSGVDSTLRHVLRLDPKDTVLVLGSVWPQDIDVVLPALQVTGAASAAWRVLIVPHEPLESFIRDIEEKLEHVVRLSVIENETPPTQWRYLIVDSIGKLLRLYGFAHAAYVGGGFGAGVHSLAEAAVYGIPVACGPRVERSTEAPILAEGGGLRIVNGSHDVEEWLRELIEREQHLTEGGQRNAAIIRDRSGSTMHILHLIENANREYAARFASEHS